MSNVIFHLRPWKEGGIWLFDDENVGLKGEAFVPSASEVIDKLAELANVKPQGKKKQISLLFGEQKFPGSSKLKFVSGDQSGVTYKLVGHDMEAWLCPAFFCYFDTASIPKELYAMAN